MDVEKIMTGGIVFKKAKEKTSEEKKVRFSDYMRGTHDSASAKKKAEYKYKRALRNIKK